MSVVSTNVSNDFNCSTGCSPNCKFDHNQTKQHLLYHLKNNIATKITASQINLLPNRNDFRDPNLAGAFSAQVKKHGPVLFMPNDVLEKNEYSFEDRVSKYKIYMFGVMPCGSKTLVILDNIEVFVDIRVPTDLTVQQYDEILRVQLNTNRLAHNKINDTSLMPMHGFHKEPVPYKRIYFNNLQERKELIKFLLTENQQRKANNKPPLETASDDFADSFASMYYFQKVARESKFNTAGWNRFTEYETLDQSKHTTNCTYVFRVNIDAFCKLDKESIAKYNNPTNPLKNVIAKDNTLVMSWDIETYSTNQNGQIPCPETYDWNIFMICALYFWRASTKPLIGVCCVDVDIGIHKNTPLTIICGTQRKVLECHFEVMSRMAPDISAAFNGSHFDWHNVREILRREKLLVKIKHQLSSLVPLGGKYADTEDNVYKYSFRRANVKIDAENDHEMKTVAFFPGIIDTDVMPVFLKLYPRAEVKKAASLNYFLAANGLESKEDMPYSTMFKIYERAKQLQVVHLSDTKTIQCHCNDLCNVCTTHMSIDYKDHLTETLHDDLVTSNGNTKCCHCGKHPRNLTDMADVGYYCIIDCQRPQELYVKRTIIADKRELSTMSFVSLYDSFYRADGMKVRNLMGRYCHKRKTAFSNAQCTKDMSEKDHYPGAFVFPPNRGLHSDQMIEVVVYDPDTGVKTIRKQRARPIFGEDFASLYPSIMMTYNLSPDMLVFDEEEANKLAAEGYTLYKINPFGYEKGKKKGEAGNQHLTATGWTVRHNGIVNNKCTNIIKNYTKYEKFIDDTNKVIVKRECCVITTDKQDNINSTLNSTYTRKVAYEPTYDRPALKGEQMGLFPFIVKKIFDKRVPVKAEYVKWEIIIAEMDKDKLKEITIKTKDPVTGLETSQVITYADAVFNKNAADSTQKALKVLANTFYGESGNFRSSVYALLVAAGITCAGQYNIKLVAKFVTKLGYTVHYGDTDSVYVSAPDNLFAECDAEYFAAVEEINNLETEEKLKQTDSARITWWTKQVEISKHAASRLMEQIADMLLADNGTLYLKMAYEEVLFPTVLTGMKKYYGTPHIEDVNFFPKKPFIRGIDVIKQGQAEISKILGMEFMMESLSPYNHKELIDLANEKINKFYKTNLDPKLFKLNARFKSMEVKNIPVKTFVTRMRTLYEKYKSDIHLRALYEPPEQGDKFEYIIVKRDQQYTLRGTKIDIKKGDQMEYLRVFTALAGTATELQIDLNYYMLNAIVGLFARFTAYHPKFQPTWEVNLLNKKEYKKMDQESVSAADRYIVELCNSITGFNPAALKQQGADFRSAFRRVDKEIKYELGAKYGQAANLLLMGSHFDNKQVKSLAGKIIDQVKEKAISCAQLVSSNLSSNLFAKQVLTNNDKYPYITLYKISNVYKDIAVTRLRILQTKEDRIISDLWKIVNDFAEVLLDFEQLTQDIIADARRDQSAGLDDTELSLLHKALSDKIDVINSVQALQDDLSAVYITRATTMSNLNVINLEKAKKTNDVIEPTAIRSNIRSEAKAVATVTAATEDYNWK